MLDCDPHGFDGDGIGVRDENMLAQLWDDQVRELTRRHLMLRYTTLVLVAFVLALTLGGCGEGTQSTAPTDIAQATEPLPLTEEATSTEMPSATDTPIPTDTPAPTDTPTSTPTPTNTPMPSPTDTPTETPTPTLTPTPTMTPTPIVVRGRGQTATDEIALPSTVSIARFSHSGKRNFIVHVYQDGEEDLLINEIGPYQGERPLWGSDPVMFDIDADGAWTVEIRPIGVVDSAACKGTGDAVWGLFEPMDPGPWEVFHTGRANFIVHLHCAGGSDLIQNEIGKVEGSTVVSFPEGPCLWEVQADGGWGLRPRGGAPWPTDTPVPTKEPKPTSKPKPTAKPQTPTPPPELADIGEQVKAGHWLFTITDVQYHKALYLYDSAEVAMGVYCVIFADIQNQASGTTYFADLRWELHGAGGNVYDDDSATFRAAWQFGGKDTSYTDLNPGQTAEIVMVFDVGQEARGLQLYSRELKQPIVLIGDAQPPQDQ